MRVVLDVLGRRHFDAEVAGELEARRFVEQLLIAGSTGRPALDVEVVRTAADRPQLPAAELLGRELDLHGLGLAFLVGDDAYPRVSGAQRARQAFEVAPVGRRNDRDGPGRVGAP